MSNPRKVTADFKFNGKWLGKSLKDYLQSVTYTDVASGKSDQLDIVLQNIQMDWLGKRYPKKGDRVDGKITFVNWEGVLDKKLDCGAFVLDNIQFSGGPLTASFGCLASPMDSSFNTRERTKTWKDVTIEEIAQEIADKYDLKLKCSDAEIRINVIEQTQKTDSAFLYDLCDAYGISMKVYKKSIVIYSQTVMEEKKPVKKLKRKDFVDDKWDFADSLTGVYSGARISYKPSEGAEEISVYVGEKDEEAKDSRVLFLNEAADSISDAYRKAAAAVNKSNQEATTLSGDIWPDPKICAGVTVEVSGLGKADGKYFVDKCITEVGNSKTRQSVEMHKCQKRLSQEPKPQEETA